MRPRSGLVAEKVGGEEVEFTGLEVKGFRAQV